MFTLAVKADIREEIHDRSMALWLSRTLFKCDICRKPWIRGAWLILPTAGCDKSGKRAGTAEARYASEGQAMVQSVRCFEGMKG